MLAFSYQLVSRALLIVALLCPATALACNVPVFRYALERWEPDPYVLVVFHRDPLTAEQQALVEAMQKTSDDRLANLVVVKANLSGEMSGPMQALWKTQVKPVLPWLVVRYPPATGIEQSVWAGPLSAELVSALVDSPARREIARRLLKAETAVWLLLGSGNQKRDDALARTLDTESRRLEKLMELPESLPDDPQMNANLPLKIAFSTLRVARSDPAERVLVNLLLNCDTNLAAATEPMLFPVFGRGRVLPPAVGGEIRTEVLEAMAGFLTGACSCQVKEMNPGYDLLMAADWNAIFEGVEIKEPELPPLISLSQFAAAATNPPAVVAKTIPAPAVLAAVEPVPAGSSSLVRNLLTVLGGGVVIIAAATFALRFRARKPPR